MGRNRMEQIGKGSGYLPNLEPVIRDRPVEVLRRSLKKRGLRKFLLRIPRTRLLPPLVWFGHRGATLDFRGQRFQCLSFGSPFDYNNNSERLVELTVTTGLLREISSTDTGSTLRVLEVGNVLNHYAPFPHRVVDKYERANGVENIDLVDLDYVNAFDIIVSISTLEHLGFDEFPREPGKIEAGVKRMIAALRNRGTLIFTVPFGYNPEMDAFLRLNKFGFQLTFLRRDVRNRWYVIEHQMLSTSRFGYNARYPFANAIAIGTYTKQGEDSGS
jgi:hypothetical protein